MVQGSRRCRITLPVDDLPLFADRAAGRPVVVIPRRADGRAHDTGLIKPNRPCPADFRERFIEFGWEGICAHYRANWRCIRRWIDETGRKQLVQERAEHVQRNGRNRLHVTGHGECLADRQRKRRRYVMGQTLNGGAK